MRAPVVLGRGTQCGHKRTFALPALASAGLLTYQYGLDRERNRHSRTWPDNGDHDAGNEQFAGKSPAPWAVAAPAGLAHASYTFLACEDIPKQLEYHEHRMKLLDGRAGTIRTDRTRIVV